MDYVKKSLNELSDELRTRMAAFEDQQRTSPATASTPTLGADFAAFKVFVSEALCSLQRQIDLLARDVDRQEMRTRRKMLLVHGVKEGKDEDPIEAVLRVTTDRLVLADISKTSITLCHRMGRSGGDKPRPILVKFSDMSARDEVWFAKTKLKGTGITLSEFLTKVRHDLFMEARKRYGVTKCWTREGNVFVVGPDGSRKPVTSLADLEAPQPAVIARAGGSGSSAAASSVNVAQSLDKLRRRVKK